MKDGYKRILISGLKYSKWRKYNTTASICWEGSGQELNKKNDNKLVERKKQKYVWGCIKEPTSGRKTSSCEDWRKM